MPNWISYPTILSGETVELLTLEQEHLTELSIVAKDKRIWEFYPYDGSDSTKFFALYNKALKEREKGSQYTFVIYHKHSKKIIGSTRLLDIQPNHKKLEIGTTWIDPSYWGTEVNLECKLLLLTYCFEQLNTVRVQLKTDEHNWRSRKAIEKIGAKFEGILRNDMIRENNTNRNSAYFSIINSEWTTVKKDLTALFLTKFK